MAFFITEKNESRTTRVGPDYIRTSTRVFLVQTDDPGYGPLYVKAALASFGLFPGILQNYVTIGTHPETDFGQQVLNVSVVQSGANDMEWEGTVEYGPWDPFTMAESPLELPPELTTEGQNFEEVTDVDIDGNPLVNKAGDPYDPGIPVDKQRQVIRVTMNLSSYPNFAIAYTDYLNETPVWGFDAKTLKQAPVQVERLFHPNCGKYFRAHFLFDQNPNGWKAKRMNVGFRQLVSGVQTQILDGHGQNISTPLPLDASGKALTPPVNAGDLITNEYDVYKTIEYNSVYSMFGSLP